MTLSIIPVSKSWANFLGKWCTSASCSKIPAARSAGSYGPEVDQLCSNGSRGTSTSTIGRWCQLIPRARTAQPMPVTLHPANSGSSISVTTATAPQLRMRSRSVSRSRSHVPLDAPTPSYQDKGHSDHAAAGRINVVNPKWMGEACLRGGGGSHEILASINPCQH